ncbi:MAG: sulfatase-like hydrolase/transferase [Algibacter sp.]
MKHILFLAIFALSILSCLPKQNSIVNARTTMPNILFIIADDIGKDAMNGFLEGTIKPNTPNLDGIKSSGLSFNNFWVNPTCSPTRAAIITGKYGFRTGVQWAGDKLATTETTLQKHITTETNNTYATALIGKWHLSGNNSSFNPEDMGIDYFSGIMKGGTKDYNSWSLFEDGETTTQDQYITEKFTDLAINWVNKQDKPWFLWLAYTAPHTPFHAPPAHMHSQGDLPSYSRGTDAIPYYMAAIEAMDYQIGRLLKNLSPKERENTIIIFIGDNGTPRRVAQTPYKNKAKGTLYQGGVNTPMFVSGYGVTRKGIDNSLINNTDLFATISEITGSSTSEINDSKSFKPLLSTSKSHRDYIYTEMDNKGNSSWTIRNTNYKIIANASGIEKMFDLITDPNETNNLLENTLTNSETLAKETLQTELNTIRN